MELREARQLARKLMEEHGLNPHRFKFTNARTQLGNCNWQRVWPQVIFKHIGLSRFLVVLNDENAVRATMLHEIAHALVGYGHNHDRVWKLKALEIGAKPNRTNKTAEMPKGRWKGTCDKCGEVFYKHRGGRHVRNGGYRHNTDGGRIAFVDTGKVLVLR
jgi:predicted SprT family Zn-dependent metalloprotease